MNLIEKWKNRETKKKLREENIRLKAEIEAHMKTPYPVCTVERNVQRICSTFEVPKDNEMPAEYAKERIKYDLISYISPFIEYDFCDSRFGGKKIIGTLYVATGDKRYES